ncbi:Cyclohexadienyl dehydratase precursor [Pseudovibrio axinellae]|uniref:Cyclohexadienyl dehydratase n=1 Tax=Pseudovibrio axinellae TaxID=989403 RepID=A0A165ZRN0_9HYPH|nr:transporter substrate-binding domain-containing protein [Pseudovibrio axinellae]KZL20208.1 Cyclohexadienyl dehydratase precursor [Pseudovibrio axinellae]SEQ61034.1 amino acid ABC transporter substrate-binding protein, PAAT family [Pseudovibrio axinellae]
MKLRSLLTIISTAGLLFSDSAFAQSALNDILETGELKVGTTGDWNPMSVRDPASNGYKGYDIDIMNELAKDLGVKLQFVPTDWKTLVNGIVAGKYDLTGSASISPSRMKVAGYSESYISVEILPFTTSQKAEKFTSWASINQEDVTVATTLGTTFEKMSKEWFPNATIKVVEAPARGYQEVLSGRADVFITSNIEGATLKAKFKQLVNVPVGVSRNPTPIAMLMPQNDQVWINYVNNWVKIKKMNGFLDTTAKKWGLTQ